MNQQLFSPHFAIFQHNLVPCATMSAEHSATPTTPSTGNCIRYAFNSNLILTNKQTLLSAKLLKYSISPAKSSLFASLVSQYIEPYEPSLLPLIESQASAARTTVNFDELLTATALPVYVTELPTQYYGPLGSFALAVSSINAADSSLSIASIYSLYLDPIQVSLLPYFQSEASVAGTTIDVNALVTATSLPSYVTSLPAQFSAVFSSLDSAVRSFGALSQCTASTASASFKSLSTSSQPDNGTTSSQTNASSSQIPIGVKIGIGFGAGALIIAFAVGVIILLRKGRRKGREVQVTELQGSFIMPQELSHMTQVRSELYSSDSSRDMRSVGRSELHGSIAAEELYTEGYSSYTRIHEAPSECFPYQLERPKKQS
jgi:hypothetical protein